MPCAITVISPCLDVNARDERAGETCDTIYCYNYIVVRTFRFHSKSARAILLCILTYLIIFCSGKDTKPIKKNTFFKLVFY